MAKPLAGAQPLLRALNARAILETLADRGALTRAELMGETGLSRTAVTQVVKMLEAVGAVRSAGVDRGTRGPAATRVGLDAQLGFALAVHIDERSVHAAAVDVHGAIRAERRMPLRDPSERAARVAEAARQICQETGSGVHLAVVGVPGIVFAGTTLRDDQGPDGGSLHTALAAALGCPVTLENDVNLAALAELTTERGRSLSSFALLSLDVGLGAGIVIDGRLHRGARGIAGEVGYLPHPGIPIGAPIINEQVVADFARECDRDPRLSLGAHLDDCASGDESAIRLIDKVAERIVIAGGAMTLVLDPEAFLLAGHAAHPALAAAVQREVDKLAVLLRLRFEVSEIGDDATLAGATGEASAALRSTLFSRIVDLEPEGRTR